VNRVCPEPALMQLVLHCADPGAYRGGLTSVRNHASIAIPGGRSISPSRHSPVGGTAGLRCKRRKLEAEPVAPSL
jgi:hypothetical protein